MKNHQISLRLIFIGILILILSASNYAQFFILKKSPLNSASVDLKFTHPVLKKNDYLNKYDQAIYSGSYDFDFSIPVSNSVNLNFIVPLSIVKFNDIDGDTDIGNIGLGIQTKKQISDIRKLSFSVSVFLPTSPTEYANANFSSLWINYYDIHKYLPLSLTLYLNAENRWDFLERHILKVDAGGQIVIPTKGNGELEFLLHYGVGGGITIDDFTVLAELSGIVILTASSGSILDRFNHTFSLGVNYCGFNVKPGIFYKFYLNDWSPYSGAVGFNIQFDRPE